MLLHCLLTRTIYPTKLCPHCHHYLIPTPKLYNISTGSFHKLPYSGHPPFPLSSCLEYWNISKEMLMISHCYFCLCPNWQYLTVYSFLFRGANLFFQVKIMIFKIVFVYGKACEFQDPPSNRWNFFPEFNLFVLSAISLV